MLWINTPPTKRLTYSGIRSTHTFSSEIAAPIRLSGGGLAGWGHGVRHQVYGLGLKAGRKIEKIMKLSGCEPNLRICTIGEITHLRGRGDIRHVHGRDGLQRRRIVLDLTDRLSRCSYGRQRVDHGRRVANGLAELLAKRGRRNSQDHGGRRETGLQGRFGPSCQG